MKSITMRLLLFSLVIGFFSSAYAEVYSGTGTGTGTIHTLRAHNDLIAGDESDWMLVNNFKSAGKCEIYTDGLVLMRMPAEEREFSVALAAQMAGKKVKVAVDDNTTGVGGACILRWINIVN